MTRSITGNMTQIWIERRVLGWRVVGVPALAAVVVVGLALLGEIGGRTSGVATALVTGGIELVVPLSAAVATGFVVGADPARELQLSLPRPYRNTVGRRALLATLAPALVALLLLHLVLRPNGQEVEAVGWAGWAVDLTWLATLIWMTAVVCFCTVALRSATAAVALMAVLAATEVLLHDLFVSTPWLRPLFLLATTAGVAPSEWWMNRVALLMMAAPIVALTALLLRRPDRLLLEEAA
jgi:hypothetical protein